MDIVWQWLIQDYLPELVDSVLSPQKRVSIIYLSSAIFVAILWNIAIAKKLSPNLIWVTLSNLFSKDIWTSKSCYADYGFFFINKIIMTILSPMLLARITITTSLFFYLHQFSPAGNGALSSLPYWVGPVAYLITLFVFDDISRYFVHRALHTVPCLWAFHKIHHSAEKLTPITVLRTHPIEGLVFFFRATFVQAITISLFVFLFAKKIDLIDIYGVNIILFIFNISGANLRHSHFPITYGKFIEKIFISPAQHQIHHSLKSQHRNKNFGAILAIWDAIFGSLEFGSQAIQLKFGLSEKRGAQNHKLSFLYFSPFLEIYNILRSTIRTFLSTLSGAATLLFIKHQYIAKWKISFVLLILTSASITPSNGTELNIYSHRQPFLINPFLEAFKEETGIKSNIVFSSKGLAQRLLAEGTRSPADVVLTVDISRLFVYADKNLLAPIDSKILVSNIPAHLRDPKNRWFALSKRARVIVISQERVTPSKILRIEDLALPHWKGRICSRPGSHVYNRALLASVIAANGEHQAEKWAEGLVANLARRPQGNDRAQIKAIHQGICDLAIVNSYYFGKLRHSEILEQRKWVAGTKIIFTNQKDRGNHINISGGGVAKFSKNKALATRFLEFLSSKKAQKLYAQINFEYPGNPNVSASEELLSWGTFSEDKLPIGVVAELAPKAQKIIDRVGW